MIATNQLYLVSKPLITLLATEKVFITDVLPYPTVSDHDAPYAIIKIPTASFQTRYKYVRNMKNLEI